MSTGAQATNVTYGANPVSAYKQFLRDLIDRRPSGTRQLIASALGKHKSFVTQITNPSYAVPVPAKHLATIFDICHFSPAERRQFVALYETAHPNRQVAAAAEVSAAGSGGMKRIVVEVPVLRNAGRQEEMERLVRDFARRVAALADRG